MFTSYRERVMRCRVSDGQGGDLVVCWSSSDPLHPMIGLLSPRTLLDGPAL